MQPVKTSVILFDAAGVLFPVNSAVQDALKRSFDLTDEQLLPMWSGLYKELGIGAIDTPTFLNQFVTLYKLDRRSVTEDIFVKSFTESLEPMPGVYELLDRLSQKAINLALLSDTVKMYTDVRHQQGYYRYFAKLFFSYDLGCFKPDPRTYQAVIDYFGVPAGEILFVDDRQGNVDGAQAQGMRAVTFENAKQLETVLHDQNIL
jgi:HAD superfamily hydrolase (TIGR01509 family)